MDFLEQNFDLELSLPELLRGVSLPKLIEALAAILGGQVRLVTAQGKCLGGSPADQPLPQRVEVAHELEIVGYLESDSLDKVKLAAAVDLIEMLLKANARYHMASRLHVEVVREDYESLAQKHAELQASEARYKSLSEHLEERVVEQVQTIESAQRQLYQAEKMASVGQLAAGMAHEINNPVGFIRSNLSSAQGYLVKLAAMLQLSQQSADLAFRQAWAREDIDFVLEDFETLLKESVEGADRVARIVSALKDFSKVDQAEEQVVDLNDCIRSVCNIAAAQIEQQAELIVSLQPMPQTRCRPGHLNQVFLNLLLNAAQAMQQRGQIWIETYSEKDKAVVIIRDNGSGIAPAVLSRIFDPFYTTRDVGQGTGLGLTVAKDIVEAHGGSLRVQSELGQGTAFIISIPFRA